MYDFYNERSKNPLLAIEGDAEFAALIKEHYLPIHQRFFEFIDELIGRNDEQIPQRSNYPTVEDCSERLKEDYSAHKTVTTDPKQQINLNSDERWTTVSLYTLDSSSKGYSVNKDALLKVKEQLKAEGIDTDSRIPTHQITAEQMKWLNSKYDLDFFSTCSITNEEFGNFMLDLAYLNVFSLEEVENMYAGVIPPQADYQAISLYYNGDPETGAGYVVLNTKGTVVNEDMPTDHISNYLKAEYPRRTETEYRQMATEFAAQFQNRLKILEGIFEYFSNQIENNADNALLKIEDAKQ